MNKRLNIVLPETTVRTIDRLAMKGRRSRFIDQAVQHYIAAGSASALRARLEEAVLRDRDLDREVMEDWLAVDREQWHNIEKRNRARRNTRGVAKSTSQPSTRQ